MLSRARNDDDDVVDENTLPDYMDLGNDAFEVKPPESTTLKVNVLNWNQI